MFSYILGEVTVNEFFIQYLHSNFHSFWVFRHRSRSSVKAIMPLSVTLPLAIGLNFLGF